LPEAIKGKKEVPVPVKRKTAAAKKKAVVKNAGVKKAAASLPRTKKKTAPRPLAKVKKAVAPKRAARAVPLPAKKPAALKKAVALAAKSPARTKTLKSGSLQKPIPAKPAWRSVAIPPGLSNFQPQFSGPKYFFSTDIPDRYNETYMRAIPRDPFWIFSYWEISQTTIENLKTALGDKFESARWVIRVSDVTDIEYDGSNAWRTMDVGITFNANNWYIKVWEPGRVYLVQAGLVTQEGVFTEAVRSNALCMPRSGVSAITDEEWSNTGSDELLMMSGASLKRSIGASERLEETELGGAVLEFGPGQGSGSGAIL
jgi:hypothetical protein